MSFYSRTQPTALPSNQDKNGASVKGDNGASDKGDKWSITS